MALPQTTRESAERIAELRQALSHAHNSDEADARAALERAQELIPKPLQVKWPDSPGDVTLGESFMFAGMPMDKDEQAFITREFLLQHTNWDKWEIYRLTANELMQIMDHIKEEYQKQSVPLVKSPG